MFKRREEFSAADRAYNIRMNPVNQELWAKACREIWTWNHLTGFEQEFIVSVEPFIYSEKGLTEKQAEKLEEIYSERTK